MDRPWKQLFISDTGSLNNPAWLPRYGVVFMYTARLFGWVTRKFLILPSPLTCEIFYQPDKAHWLNQGLACRTGLQTPQKTLPVTTIKTLCNAALCCDSTRPRKLCKQRSPTESFDIFTSIKKREIWTRSSTARHIGLCCFRLRRIQCHDIYTKIMLARESSVGANQSTQQSRGVHVCRCTSVFEWVDRLRPLVPLKKGEYQGKEMTVYLGSQRLNHGSTPRTRSNLQLARPSAQKVRSFFQYLSRDFRAKTPECILLF